MNQTELFGDGELGEIVDELLSKMTRGEHVDIEQYAAKYPDHADVLRHALPALRSLANSRFDSDSASEEDPLGDEDGSELNRTLGDFRIVRELGRGGMGVVYEAEQISMGRKVALKVLPFASLVRGNAIQRFQNEVRAAASLNHPHIVPVYSVGEERGVHYFAMQLIRGQSFAEVLAELVKLRHNGATLDQNSIGSVLSKQESEAEPVEFEPTTEFLIEELTNSPQRSSTEETVAVQSHRAETVKSRSVVAKSSHDRQFYRTIASLTADAADALDHAHQNGVIHRDIKPGNLMLDADAKLFVADFGLARIETDTAMTMSGDLIGTLRYMSPEQALAKRIVIDHRTDIYSLGMTLYEMLILRPAFQTPDRHELLKQIAFEEPTKPRQVDRSIPVELETIVLKSIEKNPEDRYATAADMADDLRAFLNDKPIQAKPPTLVQRAAKWSRRHRVFVWTSGIAVLLLMTLSITGLAVSNRLIAEERNEAEEALELADKRFQLAVDAVDKYLSVVTDDEDLKAKGMEYLRQNLLESAEPFFVELTADKADDFQTLVAKITSLLRLSKIHWELGDLDIAEGDLNEASVVAEVLEQRFGGRDQVRLVVGQFHQLQAHQFLESGRRDDALPEYRAANRRFDEITDASLLIDKQERRAQVFQSLSSYYAGSNHFTEARSAIESAHEILGELSEKEPENRKYAAYLAENTRNKASIFALERKVVEAYAFYEQSSKEWKSLCDKYPHVRSYRYQLAISLANQALVADVLGDDENALSLYGKALEIDKHLVSENPDVIRYHLEWAKATLKRANTLVGQGSDEEGLREQLEVVKRISILTEKNPNSIKLLEVLAEANHKVSFPLRNLERNAEAIKHAEQAVTNYRELVARSPDSPDHEFQVACALEQSGRLNYKIGEVNLAREQLTEALQISEELSNRYSDQVIYLDLCHTTHGQLGNVFRSLQDDTMALHHEEESFQIAQKIGDQFPEYVTGRKRLGDTHELRGYAFYKAASYLEAIQEYEKAVMQFRESLELAPDELWVKSKLVTNLSNVMYCQALMDELPKANHTYSEFRIAFQNIADKQWFSYPQANGWLEYLINEGRGLYKRPQTKEFGEKILLDWMGSLEELKTDLGNDGKFKLAMHQLEIGRALDLRSASIDMEDCLATARSQVEADTSDWDRWSLWNWVAMAHYRGMQWQGADQEAEIALVQAGGSAHRLFHIVPLFLLADKQERFHEVCQQIVTSEHKDWDNSEYSHAVMLLSLDEIAYDNDEDLRAFLEAADDRLYFWAIDNAAILYAKLGEAEQAKAELARFSDARGKEVGAGSPYGPFELLSVAQAYALIDDREEAIKLFREAETAATDYHFTYATTRIEVAVLLKELRQSLELETATQ